MKTINSTWNAQMMMEIVFQATLLKAKRVVNWSGIGTIMCQQSLNYRMTMILFQVILFVLLTRIFMALMWTLESILKVQFHKTAMLRLEMQISIQKFIKSILQLFQKDGVSQQNRLLLMILVNVQFLHLPNRSFHLNSHHLQLGVQFLVQAKVWPRVVRFKV